ncbi:MAG: hypothetical protein AVDCRST_MAG27-974, partial [uncultured Craurococcus sp.]
AAGRGRGRSGRAGDAGGDPRLPRGGAGEIRRHRRAGRPAARPV